MSTTKQERNTVINANTDLLEKLGNNETLSQRESLRLIDLIELNLVTECGGKYFLKLSNVLKTSRVKASIKGDVFTINKAKYNVLKCIDTPNNTSIELYTNIQSYIRSFAKFYGWENAFELFLVFDKSHNAYICQSMELF